MRKLFVVTAKKTCSVILYVSIILFTSSAIATTQKADNWLDEPISISFQNEALSKVLKKISEQTGVSIAYDQELANEKVTGDYQNVKTSDAITRLFRSKNISIQVNTDKKIIIVKTFGAKTFIWARKLRGKSNSRQMPLADLKEIHALQYKEYREQISDYNEIIDGGMTRGDIQAMHNKDLKEYQAQLSNNNTIIDGGMTRGDIQAMHNKDLKEYQAQLSDNNSVIDGGMTRDDIQAMHNKDLKEYETQKNGNKKIVNGRMTNDEIKSMHDKSLKTK